MPMLRRTLPVFTLHRGTMLNATITPTARLLWATLVAVLGQGNDDREHVSLEGCIRLAGIADLEAAQPYLDELAAAGLIDSRDHAGEEPVLRVNEIPDPQAPARPGRTHECRECMDCGDCACFDGYGDLCKRCSNARRVRAESRKDIARWQAQLDAGATYAYGGGTRLHRWDCPTLGAVEQRIEQMEESLKAVDSAGWWPRLPALFTAEELRRQRSVRRRCATCGPDPI